MYHHIWIVLILTLFQSCYGQSGQCVDSWGLDLCEAYQDSGLCELVTEECKATCDSCIDSFCFDGDVSCPTWRDFGFCNTDFVRTTCKLSCGSCSNVPSPIIQTSYWSEWNRFGSCSVTCGNGMRMKYRDCIGGSSCPGSPNSSESCILERCRPVWQSWRAWSACSVTCGDGRRQRTRTCSIFGQCNGEDTETRLCNLGACDKDCSEPDWCDWASKMIQNFCGTPTAENCPKSCNACGEWSKWSDYSDCSKTCDNGTKTRSRVCVGQGCSGPERDMAVCNTQSCSTQALWSPCTRTCGGGTRFRYDSKSCTDPTKSSCLKTFEVCNTSPCPTKNCNGVTEKQRFGIDYDCCSVTGSGRRVIAGRDAKLEDFAWTVLIVANDICAGMIIETKDFNWIMTAAHCVSSSSAIQTKVFAGIENYSEWRQRKSLQVDSVIIHPQFDSSNFENDIALIKLADSIKLSPGLSEFIELPRSEDPRIDSKCFVAGWGTTNQDVLQPSEKLQFVGIDVLNPGICQKRYGEDKFVDPRVNEYIMRTDKLICAGSMTKKTDTCMGDSGSALACQRCKSCRWYVAGITSFGPPGQCGQPGYPGMYVKVSQYENWIKTTTGGGTSRQESCS